MDDDRGPKDDEDGGGGVMDEREEYDHEMNDDQELCESDEYGQADELDEEPGGGSAARSSTHFHWSL
ncbi:MAG TPA: hypothetical protein DIT64_11665 [Verrucomicrobiales bacterium]|nr:hypothetical protein [Verrucomicrobiales bacterium]